jgi:hypothetical protein
MNHTLVTKTGLKTKDAIKLGYIQCHPDPSCKLYLSWDYDRFIILGYNSEGKAVSKKLKTTSIIQARKELKCMR